MLVESNLKSRAMMRTRKGIKNKVYLIGKRLLDLIISFILLLFAMPALLFISYWVYKREGAPILQKQQQMCKHIHPFIMCSFRTIILTSKMFQSIIPSSFHESWTERQSQTFNRHIM